MPSRGVRLSVRLSVTFASCVKTNKDIFEIFSPSGNSQAIQVFPCQTGWRYSGVNPLKGASNEGGVGKKCDSGRISGFAATGLQCVQPYKSQPVKNNAATIGALSTLWRPSSIVYTRRRRSVHNMPERRSNPPGHNPLGHNPRFTTEPGGYFCRKLTLTRTLDPIRPTRRDHDPNRPTNGSKQGGYDLRVFIRGVGRTPPETIGDIRTEFHIILCTSKSEAAVTGNNKTAL